MIDLFNQLGIEMKLLAAQGVNFLLVLLVLMTFVYRPLIKLMKERRAMIVKGLEDAREAELQLAVAEKEKAAVLAHAEAEGRVIIEQAEEKASLKERDIVAAAAGKAFAAAEVIESDAKARIALEQTQAEAAVRAQAANLVVRGMEKLLREEMTPERNQSLIKKLTG